MRQRLGIAAALLRRPRLLILDEPATGLDPAGMRDMRSLIRRLADEGMTVLLSSHQLPEVQELCDRVAIVDRGRVVYEGALVGPAPPGRHALPLRTTDDERALALLRSSPGVGHAASAAAGLEFQAQEHDVGELSLALGRAGIAILALTPQLATLEDLFFRLTEGASEDGRRGRGRQRQRRARRRGGRPRRRTPRRGGRVSATAADAGALPAPARGPHAPSLDADRLPLGAAQADLPEADLPRPRADRDPARCSSSSSRTSTSTTTAAARASSRPRSPSPGSPRPC